MKFLTNYSKQAFHGLYLHNTFLKGLYDFRDFRRYQKEIMDKLPKMLRFQK